KPLPRRATPGALTSPPRRLDELEAAGSDPAVGVACFCVHPCQEPQIMGLTAGRARTRLVTFFLCCLLAVYVVGFRLSTSQPAARAREPAAGDQAPPADQAAPKAEPNMFLHMLKSVGWIMGAILLLLSMALVFLVVLLTMDLRMGDSVPPAFVEDFTDTVNKRRFKEAFDMARQDNSFLGQVPSTVMA